MRPHGRERGATLILIAISITLLFLIMALVIDLSLTRSERRGGQLAVDNAAASAAQSMAFTDAAIACRDALSILSATLEESFVSGECASQFATCDSSTPNSITPVVAGAYTVTIHHPVLDSSPLMANTSTIGNAGIASSGEDGDPCDRIGVEVTTSGDAVFGGIAGSTGRSSTVYAVGAIEEGTVEVRPLNLLVLERTDCQSFDIRGQGSVVIAPSVDPSTGAYVSGIAAADSDGTTGCGGTKAVLEASGQGVLQADGPCPDNAFAVCPGEGRIPLIPSFTSGDCVGTADLVACKEGANAAITPDVEASPGRFTRAPIDHRYNCKAFYTTEPWYSAPLSQPIPGCGTATSNTDYVDELKAFVGAFNPVTPPAGWTVIEGSDCSPSGPVEFVGNVYVDCSNFRPDGAVTFRDGNVIFGGEIRLNSGDTLSLHSCACSGSLSWTAGDNYDESESSADAGWVYLPGSIVQSAGALNVNKTAVFFGAGGAIDQTGGTVSWSAPVAGPFDDLGMWSEGTGDHTLTGGGTLDLEGVFFNGRSTFRYVGGGNQVLDDAQFIANKLSFGGLGTVSMSPAPERAVEFQVEPKFGLIR